MFTGHYGVSFGLKAAKKTVPLWVLFLAVQWIDVMWSIFVLLGIEKLRIVPGFTKMNPLDLYYMPYTHGLDTVLLWSVAAALVYRLIRKGDGWASAWIVGAAVFSHWVLDLVVHAPDLPLVGNCCKIGLGLWNHPVAGTLLEAAVLFGGLFLYLRATRPIRRGGRFAMVIFVLAIAAMQAGGSLGPPPDKSRSEAFLAIGCYLAFALIAWWLEKMRSPAPAGVTADAEVARSI